MGAEGITCRSDHLHLPDADLVTGLADDLCLHRRGLHKQETQLAKI